MIQGSSFEMHNVLRQGTGLIWDHEAVPLPHPKCSVLGTTSRCQGLCPGEPVSWARVTRQVPFLCMPDRIRQEAGGSWEPSLVLEFTVNDLPGPWA